MPSPQPTCTRKNGQPVRSRGYRWLPIGVLAAGLVLFFVMDLDDYVSFETLRQNRAALLAWVEQAGMAAVLLFSLLYALTIAFSLPVGALMTIVGGFLFGPVTGTLAAVAGATVGATAVFVAARTAFGSVLRSRAGNAVERMARGFEDDAFSYLLTLRLIPIFPFWLVNIAPAFTRIRLRTYVFATAIGIVPGTLVYILVGSGLGAVFAAGESPDLGIVFEPAILLPILGLAALSLLPVVYKRWRRSGLPGEMPSAHSSCSGSRPSDDAKGASGT